MIIKMLTVGTFASNNYLVACEKTKQAVLIDSGGTCETIMDELKSLGVELKCIFHTHAHLDHITGNYELKKRTGAKSYLHKDDLFLVDKFKEQLMMFGEPDSDNPVIDEFIEDGQILEVGELKFKVIHTPGHSPGSVCFLIEDQLFAGDTLFADSVGRTDLPGGSYDQLRESIVNKLFVLDDNIKVYPGHGPSTSIGHEKVSNPFFGKNSRV